MGRAVLSVGNCTDYPYYIEYAAVNVYSIEELCYCLYENAFLLTQDIVSRQLVDWIGEYCGLTELAEDLYPCLNVSDSLDTFVTMILEYTAYYPAEKIHAIHTFLKQNEKLPPIEKKTLYADYLLQNQKYTAAIKEYQLLCEMTDEEERLGSIYHNAGVAYAGLFLFEEAASYFEKAYRTAGHMESYRQYLAAKRLLLSEQDYILFIAERKEAYDTSLLLERQIEQLQEKWKDSPRKKQFAELARTKAERGSGRGYALMDEMTEQIKTEYRAMVIR
ncbi:MAG: hypothetical protein IJ485_01230 [Lachnospiraceae bacterium]|nr:hypothetical protein [Lachnospiraceae bacterium]